MKFHDVNAIATDGDCDAIALAVSPFKDEFLVSREDRTLSLYNSNGDKLNGSVDAKCVVMSLAWCPPVGASNTGSDIIAAACSDGTLRFMKRNGAATEKKIKAHTGAATCVKWSSDGSSIATAGEDGEVKVFSKSGNLRSKLACYNSAIHDMAWNSTNDAIVLTNRNIICIHHTQKKKNVIKWECHSADKGAVLCIDWSFVSDMIVCGGEDRCYRVFDSVGVLLLESSLQMNAITSLAWSPNGANFAVGSLGSMLLCSMSGQVLRQNYPRGSSVFQLDWSKSGSQLLGVCGSGSIILADIVGDIQEWNGVTVHQTGIFTILVRLENDVSDEDEFEEEIEHRDRIVEVKLGFGHIIVCTTKQCYVYDVNRLNNPVVIELKNTVSFVVISATNFALVSDRCVVTYSYDNDRSIGSLILKNTQSGGISRHSISLSNNTIAIVDQVDRRIVQLFEVLTGKKVKDSPSEIKLDAKIEHLCLSNVKSSGRERLLLLLDEKKDLFLCSIGTGKNPLEKIGSHVCSFAWNDECNFAVAISDSRIIIWYHPNALFFDRDLFKMASEIRDGSDLGKDPQIECFTNSEVTIRKKDVTSIRLVISEVFVHIHDLVKTSKWDETVRLCRFVEKNSQAWAMLTALAIKHKNLEIADIGLCECRLIDKLQFLRDQKEKAFVHQWCF